MDYGITGEERYLAIDPGISTGVATFKENGDLIRTETLKGRDQLYDYLRSLVMPGLMNYSVYPVLTVIMEDFKLYPWKAMAQSWDKLETVRFIGAIEFWAERCNFPVVFQDPNIKGIGYRWAGISKPKNHSLSHETDAFVHGVYYLQNAGIRRLQHGKGGN